MSKVVVDEGVRMPPFSSGGEWRAEGNSLIHDEALLRLDCSHQAGMPNDNAFDRSEELHFIDSDAGFACYDKVHADYIKDVLKSIPMKVDAIDVIFGDDFMVLTPAIDNQWRPDCYRYPDGSCRVEQAWPVESTVQPHDQFWRNYIVDSKKSRLITVDRFVKRGKHFAVIQVFQGENTSIPWSNTMADMTSNRNIQHAPLELEKKYFPKFVEAMKRGDIPKSNIALMDDRIAMFEGRPQRYGTQFVEKEQGKWALCDLLDPEMVDQWRQEMDLGPLADDLKRMGVDSGLAPAD